MPAPPQQQQPAAVTVSGPLDNLLKSLTADIAQDNLAIDSLRQQVCPYYLLAPPRPAVCSEALPCPQR